MNLRTTIAADITTLALATGILIGANSSYNETTNGTWIAGYGLELNGPEGRGVELVHCYQVVSLPGFTEVDC